MKHYNTVEGRLLRSAEAYIQKCLEQYGSDSTELRFQLLEAASARLGGYSFRAFRSQFEIPSLVSTTKLLSDAQHLIQILSETSIHPAICLSILARETLDHSSQRHKGAYHTDFRLALHLAETLELQLNQGVKVIDPACGAGILLTAVSIVACGHDRILSSEWLKNSVYAADLSPTALRGTRLALASLTDDLSAIKMMASHFRIQDSLLAADTTWQDFSTNGFDIVIANPPWEKVKLTRHEFIIANGELRDYGTEYSLQSLGGYDVAKSKRGDFANSLVKRYPLLAGGEPDLYAAFTELLYKITRPGGHGALIVPASLIRSMNTEALRRALVTGTEELSITVMDNRAKHFSIDSRFKFLIVNFKRKNKQSCALRNLKISHATANELCVSPSLPVTMPLRTLEKLRPDLTVPEVRSTKEWHLFRKMQTNGVLTSQDDSPWHAKFCREVDMTRDRQFFVDQKGKNLLPVIEGRMVQHHRLGCKAYVTGEGRSAVWKNITPGQSQVKPHYWFPVEALSIEAKRRSSMPRAGFCDITGQTNERSMMASIIPPGVICGNKVPTVIFPNDTSKERLHLWLAIVNSLPFDWLLRRVVTTTVNYFILCSLALPPIQKDSLPGRQLIRIAQNLQNLDLSGGGGFESAWRIAELRARADMIVARAYGCTETDIKLMLCDFPLLDRDQPPLPGESASSITRDLLLSKCSKMKTQSDSTASRARTGRKLGAIAYLCSGFSLNLSSAIEGNKHGSEQQ